MLDRQKKKNGSQPGTANGGNQMMMRGEIMSAGQAQGIPQRKILTANQAIQQPNETEEPNTQARNNYLTNMLDGYPSNVAKKVRVLLTHF